MPPEEDWATATATHAKKFDEIWPLGFPDTRVDKQTHHYNTSHATRGKETNVHNVINLQIPNQGRIPLWRISGFSGGISNTDL